MPSAALFAIESIAMPDGRRVSVSSAGAASGTPVLYMHGSIGSPLRRSRELDEVVHGLGLRYLMVDRPGFRGSDLAPGRTVAGFAADVERVADALGLGRFGVVGVSAGAPYALACAARMPERLIGVAAVSAMTPLRKLHSPGRTQLRFRLPLAGLSAAPATTARVGDFARSLLQGHPGLAGRLLACGASRADRELLKDPAQRDEMVGSLLAALSSGAGPMVEDYLVCSRPWGFELTNAKPGVHLWHGCQDRLAPIEDALALASRLPHAQLLVDGNGHFFYKRRIGEILSRLVASDRAATRPARGAPLRAESASRIEPVRANLASAP